MRAPAPAATAAVTRHVLENGLTVLVEPLHHAPVVALQTWVRVGAADENKAVAAGLAHLHEHMLFKGTARRGVGEVARTVEAVGGEMNAWTSFDETVYHLVLADNRLELGVDLLADMLQHASFDASELAREIEVVLEEIRRAQDNPGRRLHNALFSACYARHGYKDPVLGTQQSVAATTRDAMVAFYREHYRPDNVTLVVTGSVQPAQVLACAERHFGGWRPAPRGEGPSTSAPRQTEPAPEKLRLRVLVEAVQEARVALAWPGLRAKDPDAAALDLFAALLGHGDSSRLHQALVRPRHLLGAYASSYTPKDPGLFLVGATLGTPHPTAAEATDAIERLVHEAQRLAERGPSPAELEKAKVMLSSEAAYSKETMEGQARKRGFFELTAGDFALEDRYDAAIASASAEDLGAVAARLLASPPAVVLQLPQKGAEEAAELQAVDVEAAVARGRARAQGSLRRQGGRARSYVPGALGVVRTQLPGGATLLVQPTAGEVVALRVVALGGLRAERAETVGTGTLLAACLGQQTQQMTADALAGRIAALGGGLSAFAGRNTLGLAAEFVASRAAPGLSLAYEALLAPRFADDDVARERYAQLERIRAREDSPGALAMDVFLAELFATHPYGLPHLGRPEVVRALDADALAALHQKDLSPERLVVAICGPVDPAAVAEQLVQAIDGHGPGAPETLQEALGRSRPQVAPTLDAAPDAARQVRRPLERSQAHVLVGSQGTTLQHRDRYALDVLAAALSGQSGRLFVDLRDAQSLAYSLGCSSVEGLDPGHVFVHVGCAPQKVEQALAGVHHHLQQLRDAPLAAPELERAQQVLVGGHAIDLQRAGARAMTLATGELYGLGYDSYAAYPGHVMAVTADEVREAARRHLHPGRLLEVVVGPEPAAAPEASPAPTTGV